MKKEDATLGAFFDAIGVTFTNESIMEVKNDDLCNGKPGKLKMFVNDKPRRDFRDYLIAETRDPQDQMIKLVFESDA